MKKIIAAVLIFALMLSACSNWNVEVKEPENGAQSEVVFSSLPESSSVWDEESPFAEGLISFRELDYDPFAEKAEGDTSPVVEWSSEGGPAIIYCYDSNELGYRGFFYRRPEADITLVQLIRAVYARLPSGTNENIGFSARKEKSMVIVDVLITDESAFSYFDSESVSEEFLNSIAMTLTANTGCTTGFTMNGGAFKSGYVDLDDDDGYGFFEPAPLYREISDEGFAKLRALCEYPFAEIPEGKTFHMTEGGWDSAVDNLLASAGETGKFGSAAELSDEEKISSAIRMLPLVSTSSSYDYNYVDGTKALGDAVEDTQLIPREWVETAVKQLFGAEAAVRHTAAGKYTYHAKEGVYTPPHMGGWVNVIPCIFSVTETATGYIAEAAYLTEGMNGVIDENGGWIDYAVKNGYLVYADENGAPDLLADPAILDLVENRLPRYFVEITKNSDGTLYISAVK